MPKRKVSIIWSDRAKADLKVVFEWVMETTQSLQSAINVRRDIINRSKQIDFVEQYQTDEYLGEPFRRMIVRHYKIIYKPENRERIRILNILDTRQDPGKLQK